MISKTGATFEEVDRMNDPELWTVAQLLEALRHCPPDYRIEIHMGDLPASGLATIGIDPDCETVDLFAE